MRRKLPGPRIPLQVTADEEIELSRLARRPRTHRSVSLRARIILLREQGCTLPEIARRLRVTPQTCCYWQRRFLAKRVLGIYDEPKPGMPRRITDDRIEKIIVATLESKPEGATHWSTRQMAKHSGLSQSTIGRIWRTFGLKPHRTDTHTLSSDPLFVEKVRDVVGLYMSPPENALVLSFDEKSQIQALNRTQPILPMKPGQIEKHTPDYERHGTTTLFAALNVATGKVIGKCYRRHRSQEFRKFLEHVNDVVPEGLFIHLILDNYANHKSPMIHRWLVRHPRFHLHFIPTHSSWLNLVERWFALLTERQIKRGAHTSVLQLEAAIQQFLEINNRSPKPFVWTKTAEQVLDNVARFALRQLEFHAPAKLKEIKDSGH
jgi:transposase